MSLFSRSCRAFAGLIAFYSTSLLAAPPSKGQQAPDFSLDRLNGGTVQLSAAQAKNRIVLVVLRGYPGYQCPVCNRQVRDFLSNAKRFAEAGVQVLMVYPGAARDLEKRAAEFVRDKSLPEGFDLLLDPDYRFTTLYDLRWNAPNETAYPSTFVIDQQGVIIFAKISHGHGGRAAASEILEVLKKR